MRYIRPYYESAKNLTQEQIDFLNDCTSWKWKLNSDTGLIDVDGSFHCDHKNLDDFKGLRFGKISGYFSCKYNKLKTLDGSPREVGEGFDCDHNNLKTLDGSPIEVGGNFTCMRNPLISLEGASLKIEGSFTFPIPPSLDKKWGFPFFHIYYNLTAFLEKIKEDLPGLTELLLTHHFLTPEVIKEEIHKDSYFCYYISRAWNTEPFKKKQDELSRILSQEDLQKIDALWSIGGYL